MIVLTDCGANHEKLRETVHLDVRRHPDEVAERGEVDEHLENLNFAPFLNSNLNNMYRHDAADVAHNGVWREEEAVREHLQDTRRLTRTRRGSLTLTANSNVIVSTNRYSVTCESLD